mgnify:CR=1 FL=1
MTQKRHTKIRKIISWTLTVLAIGFFIWYLLNNREIFTLLKEIRLLEILLIAVLQPVNIILSGLINKWIIDNIDQEIASIDSIMLQFANNFVNRFVSQGGAVYRSAYLKMQYNLPISKFLASIGGVYIIGIMANAALGLIMVLFFLLTKGIFNIYMLLVFAGLLIAMGFLMIIKPEINSNRWFWKKLNQVVRGWDQIRSNKVLFLKIFFFSALSLINSSIIVFIAYRALDTNIQFMNSFFYSTISSLSNIINLTPGGLGINEAILMFSSDVIGLPSDVILLGSLMLRAISMISILTLGGISYVILNYRLQKPVKSVDDLKKEDKGPIN